MKNQKMDYLDVLDPIQKGQGIITWQSSLLDANQSKLSVLKGH